MVGALGLVNGVLQALNQPAVAMRWSDPDPVTQRRKLLGFQEYPQQEIIQPVSNEAV